jgi:glutathione synthase/RimK-type ligase-like ATP-grasp enzyme
MNTIVLLGDPREAEIQRLAGALAVLGRAPLVIDTAAFPSTGALTCAGGHWRYGSTDLSEIRAIFLRSVNCRDLADQGRGELSPDDVRRMLREKDSMLGSLLRWAAAKGITVLNPVDTLHCHYYKLDTTERLRRAGIPVPDTLATNDPEMVRSFIGRHLEVIHKPLSGGAEAVAIAASDLTEEFLADLIYAPVLLQERIYGQDVRAYVLNGEIVAAGSLATENVDYRTGSQHFVPTPLTVPECESLVRSAELMSLGFTGIDFKRTENWEHFILDVNPAPMFAGFERITGLDVAGAVAGYLAGIERCAAV